MVAVQVLPAAGRMQAEVTDSSLSEGIEALGVKDSEKPAAGKEEESITEQPDSEMTAVTEEDSAAKDETGENINKTLHRVFEEYYVVSLIFRKNLSVSLMIRKVQNFENCSGTV